jgi:hypothetical protein
MVMLNNKFVTIDAVSDEEPLTACRDLLIRIGRNGATNANTIANNTDKKKRAWYGFAKE